MKTSLIPGYSVAPISQEQYDQFRAINEPIIFPNRFDLDSSGAFTAEEKMALNKLSKNLGTPFELRLGFFHHDQLVGWSYGVQVSPDTFRMVTSGILEVHQRNGLYSAFLAKLSERLRVEGFQILFSRHYATDNQVIIPKLRFGFLVSGFELTDEFGLLLRLSYYFNDTRRRALHMRSGYQQPDQVVQSLVRRY